MKNSSIAAWERWARLGPYDAMIPFDHAQRFINEYTNVGDAVLDPFAGRFTTVAAASYSGRIGVGIEINPLGSLYGRVKINPAKRCGSVIRRLMEMSAASADYRRDARGMDEFFKLCYCPAVLRFLLACRNELDWKNSIVDATLMAQILTSLHHQVGKGLSNRMMQRKSMSPRYSVKWWKENGYEKPPEISPADLIERQIKRRYRYGVPTDVSSKTYCKDSTLFLDRLPAPECGDSKFRLLFTSPPYYNLVNYHKDQWLRMWMLGGKPYPREDCHKHRKRFSDKKVYEELLSSVFEKSARKMSDNAVIIVRTDNRKYTRTVTQRILQKTFPLHHVKGKTSRPPKNVPRPFNQNMEAESERDFILLPS